MEQPLVDLPTERAVLAGITTYGSNGYDEVADILTVNAFTDEFNQIIFRCCEHLLKDTNNAQIDLASILAAAASLGYSQAMLGRPDERKLLRSIMNFPIHQSNIRNMALRLAKLEIARKLKREIHSAAKLLDSVTGDEAIDHILSIVENPIFGLTTELSTQSSGPTRLGDGVRAYIDFLVAHPCQMVGISTGYPNYDMAIGGGLRKGTVNLIGARPKIGKTTFGDNVGIHISSILEIPVLNIDTEMSKEDHRIRILANLSEVPIQDIETGKFAENSWKRDKVNRAIDKFEKMSYYYESVAGRAFNEILAIMRRWVHRVPGDGKPCVIIYDYLKLMDYEGLNKNMQEYQLLGFQISSLHNFMVRHEEARCLSFIQLNRDGISREDTDVASGSDRQIWLCDNFSIFKKKSDEELAEDNTANRKMVQLVTRQGAGLDDGDYINMQFKGQYNKIVEGKTRNQVKADKGKQTEGFVVNDAKPNEQISFN